MLMEKLLYFGLKFSEVGCDSTFNNTTTAQYTTAAFISNRCDSSIYHGIHRKLIGLFLKIVSKISGNVTSILSL